MLWATITTTLLADPPSRQRSRSVVSLESPYDERLQDGRAREFYRCATALSSCPLGNIAIGWQRFPLISMNINRREFNYGLIISVGSLAIPRFPAQKTIRVNGKRIMDHIFALAEFGKNPQGGASRVAYSDADKQGREYVLGLLRDAKLDVTIDAAGNLIGRRPGSASGLA